MNPIRTSMKLKQKYHFVLHVLLQNIQNIDFGHACEANSRFDRFKADKIYDKFAL